VGTWDERQREDFALHLPGALVLQTGAAPLRWSAAYFADARHGGVRGFEVGDAWQEDFIAAAHAEGMPVYAYTVNDEAALRALLARGVDGIETDYPGRLKALIEAR
jgi:glycerophosphoryl diester phosphodiesterase